MRPAIGHNFSFYLSFQNFDLFVTTGMLEGDGSFAPHGHTVRFRVRRS